jgi:hypothetical protein
MRGTAKTVGAADVKPKHDKGVFEASKPGPSNGFATNAIL